MNKLFKIMIKREFKHQGDVQIITSNIPSTARKIEKKPVALGEKSGHQHTVMGDYELYEDDKFMYIDVKEKGAIMQHIHESNFVGFGSMVELPKADHGVINLTPNTTYKIGIHKKYNPYSKVFEKVID